MGSRWDKQTFTGSKRRELLAPPDVLEDYPWLPYLQQNYTPGTTIVLGGLKKGERPRDLLDQTMHPDHPYNVELKKDPFLINVLSAGAGPVAYAFDSLNRGHDTVRVFSLPPLDSYKDFSGGLLGAFSGVRNHYPYNGTATDASIMPILALHELAHLDDKDKHLNGSLFLQTTQPHEKTIAEQLHGEVVADCTSFKHAFNDPNLMELGGYTTEIVTEFQDLRRIGSIVSPTDLAHATAVAFDDTPGLCRAFNQESVSKAEFDLGTLQTALNHEIGRAVIPRLLDTLKQSPDAENTEKDTVKNTMDTSLLLWMKRNQTDEKPSSAIIESLGTQTHLVKTLGEYARQNDPALVYGAAQKLLERDGTDPHHPPLTSTQRHLLTGFIEASDRRYPDMKQAAEKRWKPDFNRSEVDQSEKMASVANKLRETEKEEQQIKESEAEIGREITRADERAEAEKEPEEEPLAKPPAPAPTGP